MSQSYVDAEELDDAIVAQAAPVHVPPSRARVRLARRSVVIAERGSDERTVVLARKALERRGRGRLGSWLVWGIAGVVAFGAGGVLSSILSAEREPQVEAKPVIVHAPRVAPTAAAPSAPEQPTVRVVSVGDLPLEKRR